MQKLGIYAGLGYPGVPFEKRLYLIKNAGFDTVCLNFEKDMEKTETSWENQVETAMKIGLPVQSVHLTGEGMTEIWKDGIKADALEQRTILELRRMKQLGISTGVIHVTWGFAAPAAPTEKALNRFRRIACEAEKSGAFLALENSVFAEHLHFLLDNIKSPNIGFCYDSGHENAFTPDENLLEKYGGRMIAMHLHDNCGNYDNHFLPFDERGTINWSRKTVQLKNTQLFREYVILEPGPQQYGIEELINRAFTAAERLASM